jgi:hypothetical protein
MSKYSAQRCVFKTLSSHRIFFTLGDMRASLNMWDFLKYVLLHIVFQYRHWHTRSCLTRLSRGLCGKLIDLAVVLLCRNRMYTIMLKAPTHLPIQPNPISDLKVEDCFHTVRFLRPIMSVQSWSPSRSAWSHLCPSFKKRGWLSQRYRCSKISPQRENFGRKSG